MKQTSSYIRVILTIAILFLPILSIAQKRANFIYSICYEPNYTVRNNVDSINILGYLPFKKSLTLKKQTSYKWNKDQSLLTEIENNIIENTTTKTISTFSDDFIIDNCIESRVNDDKTEIILASIETIDRNNKNEVVINKQANKSNDTIYISYPKPNIYEMVSLLPDESGAWGRMSSKRVLNTKNSALSTATTMEARYKNIRIASHETTVNEYNKYNSLIREIIIKSDKNNKNFIEITSYEYQYTYDKHKNWITRKAYKDGKYIEYLERKIFYKK